MDLEESEDGLLESDVSIVSSDDQLYFLLKIVENNGLFQKKNFDVELFEIQEEIQGDTTIETLRSLSYSHTPEATTGVSFVDDVTPDNDTSHVEYYNFDPINQNMGVYADPRTKLCQDIINKQKNQVFDIYEDESDSPGEIC